MRFTLKLDKDGSGEWVVIQRCPLKSKHDVALGTDVSGPAYNTCLSCEYQKGLKPPKIVNDDDVLNIITNPDPDHLVCGYTPKTTVQS